MPTQKRSRADTHQSAPSKRTKAADIDHGPIVAVGNGSVADPDQSALSAAEAQPAPVQHDSDSPLDLTTELKAMDNVVNGGDGPPVAEPSSNAGTVSQSADAVFNNVVGCVPSGYSAYISLMHPRRLNPY